MKVDDRTCVFVERDGRLVRIGRNHVGRYLGLGYELAGGRSFKELNAKLREQQAETQGDS